MRQPSLISVVTVARNAAATIGASVASVLAQRGAAWELLVIDGASADGTLDRVPDDPRIRVWSAPDGGIYDAMNKGLARAQGDAVGFLNADDRFADDRALARIADGLGRADAVCGALRIHRAGRTRRLWRPGPFQPGAFRPGWMPPHPTFYLRAAIARRLRFDTDLSLAADYDFMLRALEIERASLAVLPDVLVDMAAGGASSGPRAWLRHTLEARASRRRWLPGPDWALIAKPARKLTQWRLG